MFVAANENYILTEIRFCMVDITGKQITLRTALAGCEVRCSEKTVQLIRDDKLPKGNLLDIARAAGLLGAKKTPELIPHCHPISIDHLEIAYELKDTAVEIKVYAQSIARTGLEMEVLTAASVTALTIYDLLKPVDKNLEITGLKLLEKTGGRTDQRYQVKKGTRACVLVCSDSTAAGKREDSSGKIIKEMLEKLGVDVIDYRIIPDEPVEIQGVIKKWVSDDIPFIFTTGGTGLSPRDQTVEAVSEIIDRRAEGIEEAMRVFGTQRTPWAMLSRAVAGTIGSSLVITLPGSTNGARESLQAILPGVLHARKMLKGGGH